MTKISQFALKIKGVVGRVAQAKSSDPATPSKFETCTRCDLSPGFFCNDATLLWEFESHKI